MVNKWLTRRRGRARDVGVEINAVKTWMPGIKPGMTAKRVRFIRRGRACPGHPRLTSIQQKAVDARDRRGHDGVS